MIQVASIEDSKILCEKAKHFFLAKNFSECVIEISDRPFDEWTVYFTPTDILMTRKRAELDRANKYFIAIYRDDDQKIHFFFHSSMMTQLEVVDTGELLFFYDNTVETFNRKLIRNELIELKKQLQSA
jgi:hypothetical protein